MNLSNKGKYKRLCQGEPIGACMFIVAIIGRIYRYTITYRYSDRQVHVHTDTDTQIHTDTHTQIHKYRYRYIHVMI